MFLNWTSLKTSDRQSPLRKKKMKLKIDLVNLFIPQYGLYSSFVGTFIYLLFGTSKVVPMGPTAIVALLVNNTIGSRGPTYATLLCFLTGIIQTLMSTAGMGIIINFISVPVCSGFTSASAILVITSQVKDLIGVKGGGGNLLKMCRTMLEHIGQISVGDTVMGLVCIMTVMLLKVRTHW